MLALGIGVYFLVTTLSKNSRKVESSRFVELMADPRVDRDGEEGEIADAKQIVKVYFDGYSFYGYTSKDAKNYTYWTYGPNMHTADGWKLVQEWTDEFGLEVYDYSNPNAGSNWGNILYILILVAGVVLFFVILRATSGGGGKVMNFGKTKARKKRKRN